jgi:hypothetical protein
VNQPITKNGILIIGRIMEISNPVILFNKIEIPVTPPSRKPFGRRKALRPILASTIAMAS